MKLPTLSHTFLSTYENCARKAWHQYVAKDLPREAKSPEQQQGIDVHAAFERELKGEWKGDYWRYVEPILRSDGIKHVEWSCAIAETGTPVDYWSPVAWFRGKLDVAIVAPPHAFIGDWKTGKPREDTAELRRFAVLLKAHYPGVNSIAGSYVWLKTDTMGPLHSLDDTEGELLSIRKLDKEMKALPIDTEWEPTPNPLCGWCSVKSCEHWREHR